MGERCGWCGTEPIYVAYHDREWGRPETNSQALFEKLVLDGFQAGLSWLTILKKRDNFRAAFEGFAPERIARWGEAEVQEWLRVNDLYDSYGEAFAESQVDGETLVTLTLEEMLVDVLEVVD